MDIRPEFFSHLMRLRMIPHQTENVLYKYVDVNTARIILRDCTHLYQTADKFNDPFEMHTGFLDIRDYSAANFNNYLAKKNYLTTEVEFLVEKMQPPVLEKIVEDTLAESRTNYGILCLSLKNDSTLMWSHYADKHKGVCLGFKIPTATNRTIAFHANYFDQIQPIEFSFDGYIEPVAKILFWMCAKSSVWKYEAEVRNINISQNGIIPFDPSQLCEIYYGAATSDSDKAELQSLIANGGYTISKQGNMVIKKSDFQLGIDF